MRRERPFVDGLLTGLKRSAGILLLLALTALVVVSCGGSDDTPDTPNPPTPPQPKADIPIAFAGSLAEGKSENHARTRAETQALSVTHPTFRAWAYKNTASTTETVMKDYTVNYVSGSAGTTVSNSRGWEYVNQQPSGGVEQSIKYWDVTASAYRFFGYAGSDVTASYPDAASVSLSFPVSVTSNPQQDPVTLPMTSATPLYSKLWYRANVALSAQKDQPVQLEFLQPYVKVRFLFRQSESSDMVFTLENKSFKPTDATKTIATAGTFAVTYPLSGSSTEESWSVTPVTPGTEGTDYLTAFTQDYYEAAEGETDPDILAGQKMWYVVLPAANQGTYTLSVMVNSDPRTVVVPAQYMNWEPGYEYTYIFKITDPGGVELDGVYVGFSPWTEYEGNREIYNW